MRVCGFRSVPVSYPEQRDKRQLFTLIVRYPGAAPVSNRLSNRVADLQDRKQDRLHVAGSIIPINLQYTVTDESGGIGIPQYLEFQARSAPDFARNLYDNVYYGK
ncbi:hypothetical protein PUN28_000776 [Cardiocondyla obscurior]|uniref:Uncharacterized protein n=1 Tax=Cardiocondyla obscurior TaxID=286306 RepID=A0AAW2H111_9HYME